MKDTTAPVSSASGSYLAVVTHRRAVDEVRRNERRVRAEASLLTAATEDGPEARRARCGDHVRKALSM